ncbi:unnamed protein product [Arabidopsis halleri]
MYESVDLRAEMSFKWCCVSVRSAVVIISTDSGSNRRLWFLPSESGSPNREICVQGSSNIFQMGEELRARFPGVPGDLVNYFLDRAACG